MCLNFIWVGFSYCFQSALPDISAQASSLQKVPFFLLFEPALSRWRGGHCWAYGVEVRTGVKFLVKMEQIWNRYKLKVNKEILWQICSSSFKGQYSQFNSCYLLSSLKTKPTQWKGRYTPLPNRITQFWRECLDTNTRETFTDVRGTYNERSSASWRTTLTRLFFGKTGEFWSDTLW